MSQSRIRTARTGSPASLRVEAPTPHPWQDRILVGDCIAELEKLPPKSVDLVFADPPYKIGRAHV
jgi:modification methylase